VRTCIVFCCVGGLANLSDALHCPLALTKEELATVAAEYQVVPTTSGVSPGLPLGHIQKAITVRSNNGKMSIAQGPYADAASTVGGYMIYEADRLDDAVALAAPVPAVRLGDAVEILLREVYW
jgi:hypothetical protein